MKWEYKVAEVPDERHEDFLKHMGKQGWEFIWILSFFEGTTYTPKILMYFKRPAGGSNYKPPEPPGILRKPHEPDSV